MRGKFITLEGGEGAGKSTQLRLLASWLHDRGPEVIETREPGGTAGADAIRALLLDDDTPFTPIAEAHLFAAARADHVETRIRPALAAGKWVICDRFVDSTLAYQGAAGNLGIETVRRINAAATGETWPDLTILLRTDVDTGARRALTRGEKDRFSTRNPSFHRAVAQGFEQLAQAEPDRFAVVNADQSIEQVARTIRIAVAALF